MRALYIFMIVIAVTSCVSHNQSRVERLVMYALKTDARTTLSTFEVTYQGEGEIVISGKVSTKAERAAVTEVARTVSGVRRVVNQCIAPPTTDDIIRDSLILPGRD